MSGKVKTCPACGSAQSLPYSHPLYRACAACGSLYQTHDIKPVDDYYDHEPISFTHQVGSYKQYLDILKAHIPNLNTYTVVDVGGGDGTFLDVVKSSFSQAKGTDLSPTAKDVLQQKNYWTEPGSVATYTPKVATAFQVIEHVPDPRSFITAMGLKKGDWLVLTCPGADSADAKAMAHTGRWRNLSPSHHLCLYTRQGLQQVANDTGLELVLHAPVWAACHGAIDNAWRHLKQYIKWPVKRLIGRKDPFPHFYGRDSVLVILRKN